MVHSEKFHNGAGFDLHARTTIMDYFSYMETAALRIGAYTLEFYNDKIFFNGFKMLPSGLPVEFGEEYKYKLSVMDVEEGKNPKFYQYYKLDLGDNSAVVFKFYKQFLTISISGHSDDFEDSVGLLGDYHTGSMLSRDGNTMTSFDAMGFEWQVSPEDPSLFMDLRAPQLPFEQCRLPTAARPARRHLRANRLLAETARHACAHVGKADKDLCIDDVLQTGDVGLADLW